MSTKMPYVRKSKVEIDTVIGDILTAYESALKSSMPNRFKGKGTYDGEQVNICSTRLLTFAKHGTRCSCCGLDATHFALERNFADEKAGRPFHLNLWGIKDGEEILFTHDHTLARSLGGKDHVDNTTTMCTECNHKKSIVERELKKIDQFITSVSRNTWIYGEEINIFIRKSKRISPSQHRLIDCFDIANVEVKNPGQGTFSMLFAELVHLLKRHPFDAIFIESVLNERFREWFLKQGVEVVDDVNWNAMFYLKG